MTTYMLGKLPAAPLSESVRLEPRLTVPLPPPPAELDWATNPALATLGLTNWGMMLNDSLGDCTCAAVGHSVQLMTGLSAGKPVTLPDSAILALYEAVSGYDPKTGANDNGAVEDTVLERWRTAGISGHTIVAHGRADHTNLTLVKQVIALFGFAYIGTNVPQAWESAPQVWDVSDTPIVGGHAVILIGWDAIGFWLISWGGVYKITYAAFAKYVDEVHGVVSSDWLNIDEESPSQLDARGLIADLEAVEAA